MVLLSNIPKGIAVSASGRKFSNYPSNLDPNNTRYDVAELTSYDTETPYPAEEINNPPGGSINYTTGSPGMLSSFWKDNVIRLGMAEFLAAGANFQEYFVGVQSVVIDAKDRLWVLDSGRALTPSGGQVPATHGGVKLIGIDLTHDTVFTTIILPTTVAFSDSVRRALLLCY